MYILRVSLPLLVSCRLFREATGIGEDRQEDDVATVEKTKQTDNVSRLHEVWNLVSIACASGWRSKPPPALIFNSQATVPGSRVYLLGLSI